MIETERLILRPWRDADRADFLETCNTPAVTRHLGGPSSEAQIDAAIERIRASQADRGFCFWAVERRVDGAFLGYCGLKVADEIPAIAGRIEIGWRLREDAWGRGYAREASLACLDWVWRNTEADAIVAMTVPANAPSWGLMERIGMARVEGGDFDHPMVPDGSPLKRHVLYRIARPG
jgi:RimJ/RimL family protein N-acetyltransferase